MKPVISLVVPVYKTEQFLKTFCESCLTQDYSQWEAIIVADGPSEEAKKIVEEFKDKRLIYVEKEHSGVCHTRNHGKSLAKGQYVAFTSSDFRLRPGGLRRWVQAFEDRPDADFVYGGYGLMINGVEQGIAPSEPFDPYQLTCYPYIDGGFPIKIEKCPEWDPEITSLNDWDFWIRAVQAGCVGAFISDVTYDAEMPRAGGLSHDSATHWLDRVRQIRAKNGIPDRRIVVSSLGAPFHGKRVSKQLEADFKPMPSYKPHDYDMVYLLGWYNSNAQAHAQVFNNCDPHVMKVIHWIGTDVLQLRKTAWEMVKNLREAFEFRHIVHLCECDWVQKELSEMGIFAKIVPLPVPHEEYPEVPLPKDFTIGVYAPHGDQETFEKYHLALMNSLVWTLPDVKFIFFGTKVTAKRDNEEHVGWVPIKEVIPRCSILIRLTLHDGLPLGPIEFLLSGREVITSCPLPYAHQVKADIDQNTYPYVREQLVKKIRQLQSFPSPHAKLLQARNYWAKTCDLARYREVIYGIAKRSQKLKKPVSTNGKKEATHV